MLIFLSWCPFQQQTENCYYLLMPDNLGLLYIKPWSQANKKHTSKYKMHLHGGVQTSGAAHLSPSLSLLPKTGFTLCCPSNSGFLLAVCSSAFCYCDISLLRDEERIEVEGGDISHLPLSFNSWKRGYIEEQLYARHLGRWGTNYVIFMTFLPESVIFISKVRK